MDLGATLRAFGADERGAISIDWVSLTAGILLLGIATVWAIFANGVHGATGSINGALKSVLIVDPGDPPDFAATLADEVIAPLFDFLTGTWDGLSDAALVVAHDSGMALPAGTLSIGFTARDTTGWQTLFSKDSSGFDDGGHLTVQIRGDDLWVRLQSPTESNIITVNDVVTAGTSQNLDFSFGSEGMRVYLDDQLVGSDSYAGGIQLNGEPVVIGANQWRSGDGNADTLEHEFRGTIESVEIYDHQTGGTGT